MDETTHIPHPAWSYPAVIYELNVRQLTPEGTFAAAEKHLPRLRELGIDAVWLMPIHPIGETNRKGTLGSYYAVRDYCGVNPEILGIVFTKFDPRQNNSKDMMKVAMQAANALDTKVFNAFIRSAVIVKETKSRELDLLTAAPDSTVAMDYMALADEIAKEGI